MKFIHAADLHLDTPFTGISKYSLEVQNKLKKSTYSAAKKIFETALEENVDFIILAGDVFDNTERSLSAQTFLNEQFIRLQENNIDVFIIYGNHDYFRNDLGILEYPSNVHVYGQDVETIRYVSKDNKIVDLTGFSYYQQHIDEKMIEKFPIRGTADYQIGILHGGIGDDNYAPFQISELVSKGYDYWALGHIHKREILNQNPYIIYPGDTQGRNQNETGVKGFYLVDINSNQVNIDFKESSEYIFEVKNIAISKDESLKAIIDDISALLVDDNTLVTLNINHAENLDEDVIRMIDRGELQDQFKNNSDSLLYKIYLNYNPGIALSTIDEKYWNISSENVFDLNDIKDLDNKLFNVDLIRDHINESDFLDEIKEKTQNIINKKSAGE
ncbi:metallophosphoesterase family protein [Companilactobacillus metriopterae]|uniref:metallophosphoesterase family protein n=1 Tax=Companilactobacillus metriopterae TaxID=1909267 RepID=UPI00100C127F|nr:DNA repair exonuclease [Companilactobacillus metriopterae]